MAVKIKGEGEAKATSGVIPIAKVNFDGRLKEGSRRALLLARSRKAVNEEVREKRQTEKDRPKRYRSFRVFKGTKRQDSRCVGDWGRSMNPEKKPGVVGARR